MGDHEGLCPSIAQITLMPQPPPNLSTQKTYSKTHISPYLVWGESSLCMVIRVDWHLHLKSNVENIGELASCSFVWSSVIYAQMDIP